MIPDIFPPLNQWVDVYAATGITVGTRLLLQLKRDYVTNVWEGATPPGVAGDDNRQGYELTVEGGPVKTGQGIAGCWIFCWSPSDKGTGRVCVQEYVP